MGAPRGAKRLRGAEAKPRRTDLSELAGWSEGAEPMRAPKRGPGAVKG
ncbi:hypothetical protein [Infirmifilum sp. SLHALR2]